ncbi:hypothetical protein GCM10009799_34960 [Nocardiopsis rhodophaea]|uniref:DUF1707 domain-containing protein n=1 Tax=Nocardiopsis rhodophaea TaxID=280238 RepID=A0ABN2TC12_9ACTN
MSEQTQNRGDRVDAEIRSAVAARDDLGTDYDDVVAEGLVDRIGEEIDRRIDARLGAVGAPNGGTAPAARQDTAPEWIIRGWSTVLVGFVSLVVGVASSILLLIALGTSATLLVMGVWTLVVCANVGHSLGRDLAGRR